MSSSWVSLCIWQIQLNKFSDSICRMMYFKSTGLKSSMRQSTVGSYFMMDSVMCQVCGGSECYRARSDFEMSTHFICAYLTSSPWIPFERSGETRADSLPKRKHRPYTNTCSSVWPCACPYITPVRASNSLQRCNHMSYVSQFSYLGHIWDWYKSQRNAFEWVIILWWQKGIFYVQETFLSMRDRKSVV